MLRLRRKGGGGKGVAWPGPKWTNVGQIPLMRDGELRGVWGEEVFNRSFEDRAKSRC